MVQYLAVEPFDKSKGNRDSGPGVLEVSGTFIQAISCRNVNLMRAPRNRQILFLVLLGQETYPNLCLSSCGHLKRWYTSMVAEGSSAMHACFMQGLGGLGFTPFEE